MMEMNRGTSPRTPDSSSSKEKLHHLELEVTQPVGICWKGFHLAVSIGWVSTILLVVGLNLSQHIVGPSFKCLFAKCRLGDVYEDTREELTIADRNVGGAMQIVGKIIELWFFYIACNLVFNLTMQFAHRGGLPLEYLFLPDRLVKPNVVFSRSFWTGPSRGETSSGLYAFSALVVVLCFVANLMGPAATVLLLPTKERARWDCGP